MLLAVIGALAGFMYLCLDIMLVVVADYQHLAAGSYRSISQYAGDGVIPLHTLYQPVPVV